MKVASGRLDAVTVRAQGGVVVARDGSDGGGLVGPIDHPPRAVEVRPLERHVVIEPLAGEPTAHHAAYEELRGNSGLHRPRGIGRQVYAQLLTGPDVVALPGELHEAPAVPGVVA